MNLTRLLRLTSTVVFLDTVMFAAITPVLPYYVETLGLSKTGAGILIGSYPAGTLAAALPAIWIARRFGVKLTVVLGLVVLAGSSVAVGTAESAFALDLARFGQGLSGALSWGGGLGWLVSEAPAGRRGHIIGLALAAALAGAMLGPAAGGAALLLSPQVVFGAVALLSLALAAYTLAIPPPSRQTVPEIRQIPVALRDDRVKVGLWLVLLFGTCYGGFETLSPLQLSVAGVGGLGIALAFTGAVAIETALGPVLGKMTDRFGRLARLKLCLPVAVVVLLSFGWATSATYLFVLVLLCAVSIGPLWAPATALFSDGAVDAGVDHVVSFSLSNVAWSMGGLLGAYSAGSLAELSSELLPYSLHAGLCLATLFWVRRLERRLSPAEAPA